MADIKEDIFQLKKVTDHVSVIVTQRSLIPIYYINEKHIIMIDSGYVKERQGIEELLEREGLIPKGVLSSHAHVDHAGNNQYLKDKYGAEIVVSEYAAIIDSSPMMMKNIYPENSLRILEEVFDFMVCSPDKTFSFEDTSVEVCGVEFQLKYTPGHSLDHMAFITPDNVAYLGDLLGGEEGLKKSKLLYSAMIRVDLESKEKVRDLACRYYILAHQDVYEDIGRLIDLNRDHYLTKAQLVLDQIEEDATFVEIMDRVVSRLDIKIWNVGRHAEIQRLIRIYLDYLIDREAIEKVYVEKTLKYTRLKKYLET